MNAQHTPGPWELFPSSDRDEITIGVLDAPANASLVRSIADVPGLTEQHWDNARLIAAAPELLAELRKLTAQVDGMIRAQYDGRDPLDLAPRDGDLAFPDLSAARLAIARAESQG